MVDSKIHTFHKYLANQILDYGKIVDYDTIYH